MPQILQKPNSPKKLNGKYVSATGAGNKISPFYRANQVNHEGKIDPNLVPDNAPVELSNNVRGMIMSYFGSPTLIDAMAGSNASKSKISGKIADNVVQYLNLQDGVEITKTNCS